VFRVQNNVPRLLRNILHRLGLELVPAPARLVECVWRVIGL
jgi:hypothetical protein